LKKEKVRLKQKQNGGHTKPRKKNKTASRRRQIRGGTALIWDHKTYKANSKETAGRGGGRKKALDPGGNGSPTDPERGTKPDQLTRNGKITT